jgi:transposase
MNLHANAKLGLAGRRELVLAIESGMTLKQAAACFSVSPATAHRWWHRWCDGDRATMALWDRSSRPHRQPRKLSPAEEEPILRARRETNLGPGRLAGIVRRARSTVWKVLWRHGLSRRPRGQRQSYRRYEWSRPGALLHMDVKKLARFSVPSHRVTGDRRTKDLHRGIGFDHLHCVVDDHSRIAYVELHPREDAETNARTLERALHFFAELGLDPPDAVILRLFRTGCGLAETEPGAALPKRLTGLGQPGRLDERHPPRRRLGTAPIAQSDEFSAPLMTTGLSAAARGCCCG